MQLGSLLFVIAFAAIVIGPLAGLLLGLITRTKLGPSAPAPTLEERRS